MAARKKKTRKIRKSGQPLPAMIPSDRVLRALALEETLTEPQFIKLYDEAALPRGRTATPLSTAEKEAVGRYQSTLDMDALKRALRVKTDSAALNRIKRFREQQ